MAQALLQLADALETSLTNVIISEVHVPQSVAAFYAIEEGLRTQSVDAVLGQVDPLQTATWVLKQRL
jgi:hypothetical protein